MNIFNILVKPSKALEDLLTKDNKSKIIISIILIFLYTLLGVINLKLSFLGGMVETIVNTSGGNTGLIYYIFSLINNIISSIFILLLIWGFGKIFKGKGNFIDILYVTSLALLPFVLYYIVSIFINLISINLGIIGTFIIFIPLAWYLIILSKSLSKVEEFSETTVTIVFILSAILYYFVNPIITGILK